MSAQRVRCPDCTDTRHAAAHDSFAPDALGHDLNVNRREFLKAAGAAAAIGGSLPLFAQAKDTAAAASAPETVVKSLFESLNDKQKSQICFGWDHVDGKRGLLRTFVANNWNITDPVINSDFYTREQQAMIRHIFEGMIQPEWQKRIDQQLEDDAGGFGEDQSIAIFGKPGADKFEFVMTGRHMTLRCDGNSAEHVAFGGPIFYGHAAQAFNEEPNHPGNVFWHQAIAANKVFGVLDGKQRKLALVDKMPRESAVGFRGRETQLPGMPLTEMTADQRAEVEKVLQILIEPYRQSDRDEALACLKAQGGLEKCSLAFYREGDIGNDQVWDCWRLEGPAFVWHYRGSPHVHVWANVAADPGVKTNS